MNIDRKAIGRRVEAVLNEARLKKVDLARRLEITSPSVSNYINGKTAMSDESLLAVSDLAGINIHWLVTGEGSKRLDEQCQCSPDAKKDTLEITMYDAEGGCGKEVINSCVKESGLISFSRDFARNQFGHIHNGLVCILASGESMTPTVNPGDMLVIDTTDTTLQRDGSVYVIQIGDSTVVKRLHRLPGDTIRIASDNPAAWTMDVKAEELEYKNLKIIGRVVFIGKIA